MSKLFTRATVTGSTLSGATLKSSLTTLWDALNGMGFTDASRVTVTATATLVTTQCGLLLVDCTSGSITLTLPTSGAATDDAVYNIRRIDATANTLSVLRGGTDTLEGAATAVSVAAGGILGLQMPAGGTNWRVFNRANASDPDSRIQLQSATAFPSTGTAPTYVLTPIPAITAYTANQRFRVSAHAAGTTGSNTLNVSGLGVKSLKQYDSAGAKASGVVAVGQLMDVEYDGTDFVILDPLPSSIPPGTIIDFAGTTAPTGYLVCPTSATNISRTTYAALFSAIQTTWGTGDGSTTFGMPWFPADYASVQASSNVGTQTVGAVIAHTHSVTAVVNSGGDRFAGGSQGLYSTFNSGSTGGSANLAAGVRILKCVKY